ncbi:hypothetical protein A4A49_25865 [Nicotiana attenuata]|uniref:Uncharacterized protein n=1 Tax=Nicotiana attenuata TaxID=49451 RepID=A0A1J6IBK8_NICAT|nr:hypothetical protein A4A49_25865 [Nicotiana attenuata]
MQNNSNGRNSANFRAALGTVKQGQHWEPGTSTINYGPAKAHKQSKDKAENNLLNNKFNRLEDLDNMDLDNIKLKGPIEEYIGNKSTTTPEQPNINISSSLKSKTYQIIPNQKVSPTSITNTYSPTPLLGFNNQAMPGTLNTLTQLPKAHDELNKPLHNTYNQPLEDKSSFVHGLEDSAAIHVRSSNSELHATVAYTRSQPQLQHKPNTFYFNKRRCRDQHSHKTTTLLSYGTGTTTNSFIFLDYICRDLSFHTSTPLIYTSQANTMDLPLESWLEMGLQGYALVFTMELNNQEIVLLVQNPSHLAEIVTEGIRLGIEGYAQHQWYNTQTPLLLDRQASSSNPHQWSYPMHSQIQVPATTNLLPFYPPHHMGQIYAPWFQHLNSFNPLSPYASPMSPFEKQSPPGSPRSPTPPPPPSPNELDVQSKG